MNTTPDVDIRRGNKSHRFGLTATALPEANGSQTWVSVENVPAEEMQWYILRITVRTYRINKVVNIGFVNKL